MKIATIPNKIRYVEGESFDATGMVVKAIFADQSEIVVTDYTIDKTVFAYGDEKVVVTYVYEGKTYNVDLLVNIEQKTTPINPDGPNTDGKVEKDDNKAVVIAVSVVVPVVVIAGVAAAVLVILKKKKASKLQSKEESDENNVESDEKETSDEISQDTDDKEQSEEKSDEE